MKTKAEFRQLFKNRRANLTEDIRGIYTTEIFRHTISFIEKFYPKSNIHLFLPIKKLKEIDTFLLLKQLQAMGHNCFSSYTDINTKNMVTVYLPKESKFVSDEMGIPVPQPLLKARNEKLDVVIMPLLGYDRSGTRLGYGFGYYDRFLAKLEEAPFKLGLSYFPPEEDLPSEAHDIKLNACVWPEGLMVF